MPADLLPCPFCGGAAVLSRSAGMYSVSCCLCWQKIGMRISAEQAAADWNRRPPMTLVRLQAALAAYNAEPAHQRLSLVPSTPTQEIRDDD